MAQFKVRKSEGEKFKVKHGTFKPATCNRIMKSVSFFVPGRSVPKGSMVSFRHATTGKIVIISSIKGLKQYENMVRAKAAEEWKDKPTLRPVRLTLRFFVLRPRSHFGTGRNNGKLKRSVPSYPEVRPDLSKLLRAIEDAMTRIVYRDDSQIVGIVATKDYGTREGVHITVEEF